MNGRGLKPLLHPRVGPLTVEYEVLTPLQDPDQRLIIYRAADAASHAAMDAIARHPESANTISRNLGYVSLERAAVGE